MTTPIERVKGNIPEMATEIRPIYKKSLERGGKLLNTFYEAKYKSNNAKNKQKINYRPITNQHLIMK